MVPESYRHSGQAPPGGLLAMAITSAETRFGDTGHFGLPAKPALKSYSISGAHGVLMFQASEQRERQRW
jgi:hypothetical protein